MASSPQPLGASSNVLDQLQREVNLVLEHTGRLFAAASQNNGAPPVAQASRLKQVVPGALDRFHEALDQLEDELQFAKLVMRRDLAVCREKAGIKPPQPQDTEESAKERAEQSSDVPSGEPEKAQPVKADEDVDMSDAPANEAKPDESSAATADLSNGDVDAPKQGVTKEGATESERIKPDMNESPSSGAGLHIDTNTKVPDNDKKDTDSDKPPDTAGTGTGPFSTNADLDSLFNDGASATGGGGSNGSVIGDFNPDDGGNADFDFGTFNASLGDDGGDNGGGDNDLSSLLPGLEQYANTTGSGNAEPDFSALFATDNNQNQKDDSGQGDGEQGTSFDDFMNFDSFDPGDGDGDGNLDLDFNFD